MKLKDLIEDLNNRKYVLFIFFQSEFLVSSEEQFLSCANMFYLVQHLILNEPYEL